MREKNYQRGFGSHYNSIVSTKKNRGRPYKDFGSEDGDEDFNASGPPTPENFSTPTPSPSCEMDSFNPTYIEEEAVEDFSNDADASMYNLSSPDQRVCIPYNILTCLKEEKVSSVPYNINGNHRYIISLPDGKWHKSQEDGRWF